ncbi:mucin-2-like isoform X33 [Epinephelus moara]|uniref:mucin-2-like isoform X33 n=1 Tax=Epinephelus moara TaxID=300413 RepID=UPI00214E3856|nr:mucin-2-like isoform X33 [Epinephelus moara]
MKNILSVLLFLTGLFYHASCRPRYHFINEPLAWLKAQRFCRERYTDLATIFDVEDMNRLVNSAQDSTGGFTGMAWIGLHDNLTSWRWSFSDSNYYGDNYYGDNEGDYRNWDFGQPDNFGGNQMCVTMWSGGVWVDSQCFLRNPFICYDGTTGTAQRFIFVEQEMNWTDAQLYCRKRYTDLASVRDEKENEEIQRLAQNRSVWIGFYRTREWSDKSNSTYQYWKNGQPDNVAGQQNCTVTDLGNAGLWLDERCGRELVFICYEDQDQTLQKSTFSTTTTDTVTRNKITPTNEESSGDGTSNEEVFSTTTTVTPDRITPTERISGTKITSSPQPSGPDMEKTTSIPDQTLQKSTLSTTTTVTGNKITPTDEESSGEKTSNKEVFSTTTTVTRNRITTTERISGTKITSSPQPSGPDMEKTTSIPDQTPQVPSPSTTTNTTTVTPNTRTTTETKSTTGHFGTEITSVGQPSTTEVDQTRPITNQTLPRPSHSTTIDTSTVTPNKRTTAEIESTTGQFGTEITSDGQPSTTEVDQTRPITMIPNDRSTTEIQPSTGHLSTEITSTGQSSAKEVDQTRAVSNQTPQVPSPSTTTTTTTTVTPNTRTTTETKSTTGHFGTEITSVGQPSTTEVDQTRPITNQTLPRPSHSTTMDTTTVTPNKRTTAEIESTTGQFGTEITSVGQPSTTEVDQTRPITMIPNDRSTTEIQPSTGHLSTEITSTGQSSAKEVDQTRAVSNQTPQVPSPSTTTTTTTVTPNTRTTTETKSTSGHFSTEITSVGQPSTTEVDQTRPITNQTLPRPSHSTTMDTTTVTPNKRTTAEIESTTGQFGTEITSVGQPSTTEVDQTRPITMIPNDRSTTEIQPSTGHLSTEITSTGQSSAKEVDQTRAVSMTPDKRTTTEIKSTTGHASAETTSFGQPSTSHADQTRPITDETPKQPALSTTKMTTMERDSSSTMVSSQQYSTATGDQTNNIPAQHVVALRLKLTSQTPLTEDDIEELVLVQFRNLLIEMGLPTSIKVGVKSTEIMSNKETDTDG